MNSFSVVNIKPVTLYQQFQLTKLEIHIIDIVFNTSVQVRIKFPEDSKILPIMDFVIEGEEYQQWLNDDTYVVNLILSKLNSKFTLDMVSGGYNSPPKMYYEGKFEINDE